MAFDANKRDQRSATEDGWKGSAHANRNPYESLASDAAPSPSATGAPGASESFRPGYSGGTATGHVNFGDIYNANAGTAQREAGRLQNNVQQKAQKAQQGLAGAQSAFGEQVRTGTTQGPSGRDYQRAAGQLNDFAMQTQGQVAPQKSGWQTFQASQPQSPNVDLAQNTEENWRGRMETGAKRGYMGPSSLTDLAQYQKLLQDTQEANKAADALGTNAGIQAQTGGSALDAALLNAAGRPGFSRLQQQYGGGKLTKGLEDAVAGSVADVARAKQDSAASQSAYTQLLQGYDARTRPPEADQKGPIVIGAAQGVGNTSKELGWVDAPASSNTYGDTTLTDTAMRGYGAQQTYEEAKTPGNEWLQGIAKEFNLTPNDMDLIRQAMTEADWAEYQKAVAKGPENIKAWFDMMIRKAKAK